jgi:hypothetical protein
VKDSGDNRLSHQRHYHGPGGLNGRVRNGNGCDPASMVAGNVPGRRSGAAGHWISDGWSHIASQTVKANEWLLLHDILSNEPYGIDTPIDGELLSLAFGKRQGMAAPRSGWSSCLAVRTGRLKRSPALHSRPIDLVVFQEPTHFCWKPHLGGGFALRCLQRLSCPDLATRRCPERDSRHTRGRSSPILSY